MHVRAFSLYVVFGSLLQSDECAYGGRDVLVARCLSAPRRTVGDDLSGLLIIMYDGIVVVQQLASGDVFQPETGVRALSGSAFSEEEVGSGIFFDDGSMHQQGAATGSVEGVGHHQYVVERESVRYRPMLCQRTRGESVLELCRIGAGGVRCKDADEVGVAVGGGTDGASCSFPFKLHQLAVVWGGLFGCWFCLGNSFASGRQEGERE